jgi:phosphopantothenate-cysteine ligase
MQSGSSSSQFSAEEYFATQPPPLTLDHDVAGVRDFVTRQLDVGRKVVLVTVRMAHRCKPFAQLDAL